MNKKVIVITSIAVVLSIVLGVWLAIFSGIVPDKLSDVGQYKAAAGILKVNYAITKNEKSLHTICSYLYMAAQNDDWNEEILKDAYNYYGEYYDLDNAPRDNIYYMEYISICGRLGEFSKGKDLCVELIENTEDGKVLIADFLKLILRNGGNDDKQWVKDIVEKILTNEKLMESLSLEDYGKIVKYYNEIFN